MSVASSLGETLGNLASSEAARRLVQGLAPDLVQGMLDGLNANGLGAKVNSWLGRGPNAPLTVDEIREALGNEKIRTLATSLGLPADQLAQILAEHLPATVEKGSHGASPPAAPAGPV